MIEEEVAKRVEELVAQRVEEELEKRKDEIEQEVLRRVEEAKRIMEKQMLEEMEKQRQVEMEAQKKKEVKNDTNVVVQGIHGMVTSAKQLFVTFWSECTFGPKLLHCRFFWQFFNFRCASISDAHKKVLECKTGKAFGFVLNSHFPFRTPQR